MTPCWASARASPLILRVAAWVAIGLVTVAFLRLTTGKNRPPVGLLVRASRKANVVPEEGRVSSHMFAQVRPGELSLPGPQLAIRARPWGRRLFHSHKSCCHDDARSTCGCKDAASRP